MTDHIDQKYKKCILCDHFFFEHYTTYCSKDIVRNHERFMGCSIKYYLDKSAETDALPTMQKRWRACPCTGFVEIQLRDENGNYLVQ